MPEALTPIREQVYLDPRPPEHFERFHARARTRDPDWVYDATHLLTALLALTAFRLRVHGAERVPGSGPVILAPNHASFMDHFFVGGLVRRKVRFMAKSQLFTPPLQWIYTHGGAFPVRRGQRDEEAFITAKAAIGRAGCVAMYVEGGRSRSGLLAERARPGVGRLALETGAPVVPTAIHGSERVRDWRRGRFPRITVAYGEPVRWERVQAPTRDQQQAVADAIFTDVRALYARLAGNS
jgi:1-acyl-sn-glycerol-3-phosphate acyltransferase